MTRTLLEAPWTDKPFFRPRVCGLGFVCLELGVYAARLWGMYVLWYVQN